MNVFCKFIVLLFIFFAVGCAQHAVYQSVEIAHTPFREGFVKSYFFENRREPNDEYVFIYIGGSGPTSVLGRKFLFNWRHITFAYDFSEYITMKYDLFIPEKPNTEMGKTQRKDMRNMEYRISGYVTAINAFLATHEYHNIILVGFSEGGGVLPMIYFAMHERENVKGMVIMSSGALPLYECFQIQKKKTTLPFPYTPGRFQAISAHHCCTAPILKNLKKIITDKKTP